MARSKALIAVSIPSVIKASKSSLPSCQSVAYGRFPLRFLPGACELGLIDFQFRLEIIEKSFPTHA